MQNDRTIEVLIVETRCHWLTTGACQELTTTLLLVSDEHGVVKIRAIWMMTICI